jgi:hypothetical protein
MYVRPQIELFKQKTDFQETGTRHYAAGAHTNVNFFFFLCVLRAKLATLNLVPEVTHANTTCFFNLLRHHSSCCGNLMAYEASFRRESKVKTEQ